MSGPLGNVGMAIAGALSGGAAAEQGNIHDQQRLAVEQNFKLAEAQHNMEMTFQLRKATADLVKPQVDTMLRTQKLAMPGEPLGEGESYATPEQIVKANSAAYMNAGIMGANEIGKAGAGLMEAETRGSSLIEATEITGGVKRDVADIAGKAHVKGAELGAEGQKNKGLAAAQEATNRAIDLANQKYANTPAHEAAIMLRSPAYLTLPPADQEAIRIRANTAPVNIPSDGALNSPAAPAAPAAQNFSGFSATQVR